MPNSRIKLRLASLTIAVAVNAAFVALMSGPLAGVEAPRAGVAVGTPVLTAVDGVSVVDCVAPKLLVRQSGPRQRDS